MSESDGWGKQVGVLGCGGGRLTAGTWAVPGTLRVGDGEALRGRVLFWMESGVGGCASTRQWLLSSSSRDLGVGCTDTHTLKQQLEF